MSEPKATHTPGPWQIATDDRLTSNGERLAIIVTGGIAAFDLVAAVSLPLVEHQANARLIAAAPDLYEALSVDDVEQIIDGIEHFIISDNDDVLEIWQPYIRKLQVLRAAIQKAEQA